MSRTVPLALALLLAACAPAEPAEPARQIAILVDRSDSMEDGTGASCDRVRALVERAFDTPGVGYESRVHVFATGDAVGRRMPPIGAPIRVPVAEGSDMEAVDAAIRVGRLRTAEAACRDGIRALGVLDRSPVYDSVAAVVEQMRADWGCGPARPCSLFIASDLQETVSPGLAAALRAPDARRDARIAALPVLDLDGIDVFACGTGDTREHMSEARTAATRAAWGHVLGGVPLSPLCE